MKKSFTLAEILITLGIIGVVVAMVLPELKGVNFADIFIVFVVLAVIFGGPILEALNKKRKPAYKKSKVQYDYDAKIVKDYAGKAKDFIDKLFDNEKKEVKMERNGLAGIVAVIALFIVAVMLCNPIVVVGAGERGVKVTLGKVSQESFGEGMHFITPYISKIVKMDVKTQKYSTQTHVYTKDIQQAKISYVVNYNLLADSAFRMYQEVGMDYVSKVINPVLEGTIKDVIGKWNAQDLVANREEATNDILVKLRDQLVDRYVNVTSFQIVDINYSEVFERAIESKVTAEQDALKAKNKTVQIQEEARQKVISAEAEAKSMSIRANALTQNKALVEYEAVQKWNGILPTYMMGNSVPFINLK